MLVSFRSFSIFSALFGYFLLQRLCIPVPPLLRRQPILIFGRLLALLLLAFGRARAVHVPLVPACHAGHRTGSFLPLPIGKLPATVLTAGVKARAEAG